MAHVLNVILTETSNKNHIDALLGTGPDWNFLTDANNTIRYTFATDSGNEAGKSGQTSFSGSQQTNARAAMSMVSAITGINFVETVDGNAAQVHFANSNIGGASTSGLCSWHADYTQDPRDNTLLSYSAQAYIYLDNVEFGRENADLAPGGRGYETLLREIGHMLGLKHPAEDSIHLPADQDNTAYTLMSYNSSGGPYSAFAPYDIAALNWLYGRDGLRGAYGASESGGRYLTGTVGNDLLMGNGLPSILNGGAGDDILYGGSDNDTAIFSGAFNRYAFFPLSPGVLAMIGDDGSDKLHSIENLRFDDRVVRSADMVLTTTDTIAPIPPGLVVSKSATGYIAGNTAVLSGFAEAGAVVRIFSGSVALASAVANRDSAYQISLPGLADGTYRLHGTATDTFGNTSLLSAVNTFKVDVTAPAAPTASVGGNTVFLSNQPLITGSGEAGSVISVTSSQKGMPSVIGDTTVGASGVWTVTPLPLPNGTYSVEVKSTDGAGHSTPAAQALTFTVNSSLSISGQAGNDSFNGAPGNHAFDGLGGIDTVRYANPRASYTVNKSDNGFTIAAVGGSDGLDTLFNIERLQFSNGASALDVAGNGGQSYRIYKAAFDRIPDLAGLGFWMKAMDDGQSLRQVAQGFVDSPEFGRLYGANASHSVFVAKLYEHVLHRGPDVSGFNFWLNGLDTNAISRADLLAYFSESNENQAQVIGQIQNGFDYIAWI